MQSSSSVGRYSATAPNGEPCRVMFDDVLLKRAALMPLSPTIKEIDRAQRKCRCRNILPNLIDTIANVIKRILNRSSSKPITSFHIVPAQSKHVSPKSSPQESTKIIEPKDIRPGKGIRYFEIPFWLEAPGAVICYCLNMCVVSLEYCAMWTVWSINQIKTWAFSWRHNTKVVTTLDLKKTAP